MFLTKSQIKDMDMCRIPFDKKMLDLYTFQNYILMENLKKLDILYRSGESTYCRLYGYYLLIVDLGEPGSLSNVIMKCYVTRDIDIYLRYSVYEQDLEKIKNKLK